MKRSDLVEIVGSLAFLALLFALVLLMLSL